MTDKTVTSLTALHIILLCNDTNYRKFMDEEVYSNLAQAAKPYTGTMLQNIGQRVEQARLMARREVHTLMLHILQCSISNR
jgi:hypothetical protein